jgi:hypothetical protein
MPEHSGEVGVSCSDCYFRQELLCALKTERVCPTFRRTVRRNQQDDSAVTIPEPGVVHQVVAVQAEAFQARPAESVIRNDQPPAKANTQDTAPISSVQDVTPLFEHEPLVSETSEVPTRAAAASRTDASKLSIEIEVDPEQISLATETHRPNRSLSYTDQRRSRIASRVAERYPSALQTC